MKYIIHILETIQLSRNMGMWWWWGGGSAHLSAKHRLYIKDEETIVKIDFICKITPIKYTLIASIIDFSIIDFIKWTVLSNTKYHFIT